MCESLKIMSIRHWAFSLSRLAEIYRFLQMRKGVNVFREGIFQALIVCGLNAVRKSIRSASPVMVVSR